MQLCTHVKAFLDCSACCTLGQKSLNTLWLRANATQRHKATVNCNPGLQVFNVPWLGQAGGVLGYRLDHASRELSARLQPSACLPSGNLRFLVSFATSSRAYSPTPRTSGSVIADLVAGTTMFTSSRWECNPQQQLRQRLRSMIWSEPSFCSGGPKPGLAFARCFVKP